MSSECNKLWNAVLCLAVNDAIKPFKLSFEFGENYKKMFFRQYKNFLKRKENPFDMPDKINTGEPLDLARRKARVWFEGNNDDFRIVCYNAGMDEPEKISREVLAMCALVDDYKNRYETEGKKQHEGKDSKYIVFLATNEQVMQ